MTGKVYLVGAEGLFRVLDRDRSVHRRIAVGSCASGTAPAGMHPAQPAARVPDNAGTVPRELGAA